MKSFELQPTIENLVDTYQKDCIRRNRMLHRFVNLINSIDGNCVIAVDNQWGGGKTFFVKQTKLLIDSFNEYNKDIDAETKFEIQTTWKKFNSNITPNFKLHVTAYYDAWEYDNDDDPLLSLVYEMYKTLENSYTFSSGPDCLGILGGISSALTKFDLSKLIDSLTKSENPLDLIEKNRDLHKDVNEFLESLLAEKGDRLVVFIDELDRCKPSFAIKLLERIKHYFSNDRITFVLSINSIELQNTIKQFYGQDFDSCRYLDRFFDLRVSLPRPDLIRFYESLEFYSSYHYYDIVTDAVIKKFNFELREITRYIKLIKIAGYKPTHEDGNTGFGVCSPIILSFVPIIIGLKMYNTELYLKFVNGEAAQLYVEIMNNGEIENWLGNQLLDYGESYSIDINGTNKSVSFEEKLRLLYETVFLPESFKNLDRVQIGKISINKRTKSMIEETISLLSDFAQFDY